jgi:hypothetical protein
MTFSTGVLQEGSSRRFPLGFEAAVPQEFVTGEASRERT